VDLTQLFDLLGKNQITSVIVEGGSEIATTVLEEKLAQKGAFFIAAKILGAGKNAFEGVGVEKMDDAMQLKRVSIRKLGEDVLVMGYL
jgi:diaminohydroxyphosphoribosylaminopyrimidine deaminase/5-amino-6-(5-phosphoribosylamino)uracil reductase